jgi:hypothetical protein
MAVATEREYGLFIDGEQRDTPEMMRPCASSSG